MPLSLLSFSPSARETIAEARDRNPRSSEAGTHRLLASLALSRWTIGPGQVQILDGANALLQAAAEPRLVVATSHITHRDPQIPFEILTRVRKGRTGIAANSQNFEDTNNIGYRLAGQQHFYPVPFIVDAKGQRRPAPFTPADYASMLEALSHDTAMVVAAHTPTPFIPGYEANGDVPRSHPGLLAPYLALAGMAKILPVAVNIGGQAANPGQFNTGPRIEHTPTDITVRFGTVFVPPEAANFQDASSENTTSARAKRARLIIQEGRRITDSVADLSRPF